MHELQAAVAEIIGYRWYRIVRQSGVHERFFSLPDVAGGYGLADMTEPVMPGWSIPDFHLSLDAIHGLIMDRIVRGPGIEEVGLSRGNEALFQDELDAISEREQVPVWHFGAELYAEAFVNMFKKHRATPANCPGVLDPVSS